MGGLTRCGFSRVQDVGASGGRHPPSLLEVMVTEMWGWGADRMLLPHDWEELGSLRGEVKTQPLHTSSSSLYSKPV